MASRFDTLPGWLEHQPYEELSCQGAPVASRFQGEDSGHSYSYPAEVGVSYSLRFQGTHDPAAGIIAGVYDAQTGTVIAIDGAAGASSIKLSFAVGRSGKVIIAVFSAFDTAGDYNLSISCNGQGPVFCIDDSFCDADSFCGCVDSACTGKVCKPRAEWGESCGGFVPPQYATVCAEGLMCAGGQPAIDMPGRCSRIATVAEILQDVDTFEDLPVVVLGYVQNTGQYCSKMMCSPSNPCCNTCGAEQTLFDATVSPAVDPNTGLGLRHAHGQNAGFSYGCSGNDCDFELTEDGIVWKPGKCTVDDTLSQYFVAGKVGRIRAMDAPVQWVYVDVEEISLAYRILPQ